MKNIIVTIGIGVLLVAGFGFIDNAVTEAQISQIPNHLKLKVHKNKILRSEGYKNKEGADEVTYQYISDKEVPAAPNEIIEKRLPDAKFFPGNKENEFTAEITLGDAYHKDGETWFQVDYATTTKEAYEEQTKSRLGFIFSRAFADDFISSNNSYITGNGGASYATARTTSSGFSNSAMQAGQIFIIGQYEVYRPFMKFNTSTIGSGSTVTQVNFRGAMTTISNSGGADFDIAIHKYDWSGGDPIAAGNREANYDGCLASAADDSIWLEIAGKSTGTAYTSGNLDTAWVNKTGSTYYCYMSSNDIGSAAPAADEYVVIAKNDNATVGLRPTLIVAFTAPPAGGFGDFVIFD